MIGPELLLVGFLALFFGWLGLVLWSMARLLLREVDDDRRGPRPNP